MNLRFKRQSGEVIFEMPQFTEQDLPAPNSYITIDGIKFLTKRHERVYCHDSAGDVQSYFDITVQSEEEYNDEMTSELPETI